MGVNLSTQNFVNNITDFVTGKKRKRCENEDEADVNKIIDIALHTPKRYSITKQYYLTLHKIFTFKEKTC